MALLPDPRQNFQQSYSRKVILYLHCWTTYLNIIISVACGQWPNSIKVANLTKMPVKYYFWCIPVIAKFKDKYLCNIVSRKGNLNPNQFPFNESFALLRPNFFSSSLIFWLNWPLSPVVTRQQRCLRISHWVWDPTPLHPPIPPPPPPAPPV